MIKTKNVQIIDVSDWDKLVEKTYSKPYSFQQQDDCRDRGHHYLTVPENKDDFENDTVPEKVNHPEMGVSFKAWLERDPEQKLSAEEWKDPSSIQLWWYRNFYPDVSMVANDLYARGLLPAGNYMIDIDW